MNDDEAAKLCAKIGEACEGASPEQKLQILTIYAKDWMSIADAMGIGLVVVASHPVGIAVTACNVNPDLAKDWMLNAALRPNESFVKADEVEH